MTGARCAPAVLLRSAVTYCRHSKTVRRAAGASGLEIDSVGATALRRGVCPHVRWMLPQTTCSLATVGITINCQHLTDATPSSKPLLLQGRCQYPVTCYYSSPSRSHIQYLAPSSQSSEAVEPSRRLPRCATRARARHPRSPIMKGSSAVTASTCPVMLKSPATSAVIDSAWQELGRPESAKTEIKIKVAMQCNAMTPCPVSSRSHPVK